MIYEMAKEIIDVGIDIPPEIPLERISKIIPPWEVFKQTDSFLALRTEDQQKLISMFKYQNRTEAVCASEYGKNSQNLKELTETILKVARLAEKSSEIEKELKSTPTLNNLIYPTLPNSVDNKEVSKVLDNLKAGRLKRAILTTDDEITYGFCNGENKFTVAYICQLIESPSKYQEVLKKFDFPDATKRVEKKVSYIS